MSVEILRDNFTRADSATLGAPVYSTIGAAPYTELELGGGVARIVSNFAEFGGTTTDDRAGASMDAQGSNHGIFVVFSDPSNNSTPFISVRMPAAWSGVGLDGPNSTDYLHPTNSWSLTRNRTTGLLHLFGMSGTTATVQSASLGTFTLGVEYGLVSQGDWILVFIDGRLVDKRQSTLHMGNTWVGLGGGHPAGTLNSPTRATRLRVTQSQSSYPNPGMPKMAYDRDGTVVTRWEGGFNGAMRNVTTFTDAEKKSLNDTLPTPTVDVPHTLGTNTSAYLAFAFPEPRICYGFFATGHIGTTNPGFQTLDYSTAPVGTALASVAWTSVPFSWSDPKSVIPQFRTDVFSFLASGVTFLRSMLSLNTGTTATMAAAHIYGVPTVNSNVHRVAFWHAFFDMRLPGDYLDMDDIIRGTTVYREFRIKNNSTVYTMNNIVLDLESLESGTTLTNEYSIKRASQGTYGPNTTIASLAPGAISEIISVRRIVSATAPFRLDAPRVRSQIGSLT